MINITSDRIARMVQNFKDNVREIELDIDYDHKEQTGKAAGWVKDMESRGNSGLWFAVEFTPEAYKALANREYRYFSPEFADEWEHPKSGVTYQDVVCGGAITNRPFLKDILPINLSEAFALSANPPKQGENVDLLRKLAALLGVKLSEEDGADNEAAVLAALEAKLTEPKPPVDENKPTEDPDKELAKLAETNETVKKLMDDREADRKRLAQLELKERATSVGKKLSDIKSDKLALTPTARDNISALCLTAPNEAYSDRIIETVRETLEKGIVELGERGASRPNGNSRTATQSFDDRVKQIMKEEKLSYTDAAMKASEDSDLADAYLRESVMEEVR
jgi:phage I-like protein